MNPAKVWDHLLRLTKPGKRLLGVRYHAHNLPARMYPKQVLCAYVELENSGYETWQLHHPAGHSVDFFVRWDAAAQQRPFRCHVQKSIQASA